MTPGLGKAQAPSLSVAKARPAEASSNLVPVAGAEQLRRRHCGRGVWNCRQELLKPLAFSSVRSPQRRASKLLDPPSREFDRSVFGLLRWPSSPGAPESLAHSK